MFLISGFVEGYLAGAALITIAACVLLLQPSGWRRLFSATTK
jgi:hypothetical protein